MNNLFKDHESVIVNGFGKNNNYSYKNKLAIIICRDSYFKDYNVKFENGTEDWINEKYLKKTKRRAKI